ncbi:MAG TPA: enoyl-CoA hydratase-related protein [Steroidobacteraceae bacterium]
MSDDAPVTVEISGGVAHLTLNRPGKRNALDRATLNALSAALEQCREDSTVRMLQLSGAGYVFCAGADLTEMQAQVHAAEQENRAHAEKLARLLAALDAFPKPTLARINGDGYGGALGLIAACDIAIVAEHAKFAFTEVRLGIIPAVVSPFVLGKISESAALRYFLTAEPFSAATLKEVGLAHEVVSGDSLDAACNRISSAILKGAPEALREAKALIRDVSHAAADARGQTSLQMAARLAKIRVTAEAQEGFSAFFEKRKATWRAD